MIVAVVRSVHCNTKPDLLEISGAADRICLCSCHIQGGQKHAGKDCDDRNYHEELYKGEPVGFAPTGDTMRLRFVFHDVSGRLF